MRVKHNILITAGNTWAPIDDVRVITNIFSGETGLTIAYTLAKKGFNVTLILGDIRVSLENYKHRRLKIIRALTFKSFFKTTKKEVQTKKYKVLIHAAAISDFLLKKQIKGKVKSTKQITLALTPTPKIVDKIKKWDPEILLIKFKLEANISKDKLFKIALKSKKKSQADLIIANKLPMEKKHIFYLLKSKKQSKKIVGKKNLALKLASIFHKELNANTRN